MNPQDIIVSASHTIPIADIDLLILFKERADEFFQNYQDIVKDYKYLQVSFGHEPDRQVTASGFHINRHRIKGLLVDYRALQAYREKIKFMQTAERIKRFFDSEKVSQTIDINIKIWNDLEYLSGWKGYAFDDLVSILFNSQLFHTDPSKQADLREVRKAFTTDALSALLFFGVQRRAVAVRNLLYILAPFSSERHEIRIPERTFF
jgi:hypothetical protein